MRLLREEPGLTTIEYVLVISVAVALSAAVLGFTGITSQILALICPSVDTASLAGSCVGP
jgi:Flp pilus assembly pilin Flp